VRGKQDVAWALLWTQRDSQSGDFVKTRFENVAPAELDEDFTSPGFLRAEGVARDSVYISSCLAHLLEQRGG